MTLIERAMQMRSEVGTTVLIPKQEIRSHGGPVTEDLIVPITALNDEWLTDNQKTIDEVDYVLEGRLEEIRLGLQDPKHYITAQEYGIERELSPALERFLSYVTLFDEYTEQQRLHTENAQKHRNEYEREKDILKSQRLKQNQYTRTLRNLQTQFFSTTQAHQNQAERASRVKDLIMRKATLEYLSFPQQTNTTEDQQVTMPDLNILLLPRIIQEARERQNRTMPPERRPVDQFVDSFADHLQSTTDSSEFAHYQYKPHTALSRNFQDCQILDIIEAMSIDPHSFTEDPKEAQQLRRLGESALVFLKHRNSYISTASGGTVRNPRLVLFYDLLNTALSSGRASVFNQIGSLIDRHFKDERDSGRITRELNSLQDSFYATLQRLTLQYPDVVQNVMSISQTTPNKMFRFVINDIELPQEMREFLISDTIRIFNGLLGITSLKNEEIPMLENLFKTSTFSSMMDNLINTYQKRIVKKNNEPLSQMARFATVFPKPQIYAENGITTDINLALNANHAVAGAAYRDLPVAVGSPDTLAGKHQRLQTLHTQLKQIDFGSLTEQILTEYGNMFWQNDETIAMTELHEKENNYLWTEILDKSEWFVSPRGDRFQAERDPLLSNRGIHSVTYKTDRRFPREHLVEIRIPNIQEVFQLWFDTHRHMLDSNHQPLNLDIHVRQAFTNMLLKRLYFITSGILSRNQDPHLNGEEDTSGEIYRRACYRTLTNPRFHMQSQGAATHANEILRDYGIDIYKETDRRRNLGILRPTDHLTFAREVVPERQAMNILPNILTYDNDLVQIPIQ